jgi:hypothetical protein
LPPRRITLAIRKISTRVKRQGLLDRGELLRSTDEGGTPPSFSLAALLGRLLEVSMIAWNQQWWLRIGLGLLGGFVAIQLVPYSRDHTNPPITGEPTWDAPETRALAKQACFDCHSNETEWPAYASIAPASWLVQRDVNDGRAVLNFSEWARPQEEATEASEEGARGRDAPDCVHAGPCPRSLECGGSRATRAGAGKKSRRATRRGARTRPIVQCW